MKIIIKIKIFWKQKQKNKKERKKKIRFYMNDPAANAVITPFKILLWQLSSSDVTTYDSTNEEQNAPIGVAREKVKNIALNSSTEIFPSINIPTSAIDSNILCINIALTTVTCEIYVSAAPIPNPSIVEWITNAIQKALIDEFVTEVWFFDGDNNDDGDDDGEYDDTFIWCDGLWLCKWPWPWPWLWLWLWLCE